VRDLSCGGADPGNFGLQIARPSPTILPTFARTTCTWRPTRRTDRQLRHRHRRRQRGRDIDVLLLATGFICGRPTSGIEIIGGTGATSARWWRENRFRPTGVSQCGFPTSSREQPVLVSGLSYFTSHRDADADINRLFTAMRGAGRPSSSPARSTRVLADDRAGRRSIFSCSAMRTRQLLIQPQDGGSDPAPPSSTATLPEAELPLRLQ